MVNFGMIDTVGSGIRRMFTTQRQRNFPMPDYELNEPGRVRVRLIGKVIDEKYTWMLADRTDLNLMDVIALDKVQKGKPLSDDEFFFPWKDIFPEKYRQFESPLGQVRQQETLIQGMLPKETLLDLIRTCSVFMNAGTSRIKVMARYQQYRAVCKIIDRLRKGETADERSGVVWHTQGSGKSLTMVFVIRKIRMCDDLKDYKICLINDRTDLEKQLGETAEMTGEKVTYIASSADLKEKLKGPASNLNMVMIHKFQENTRKDLPDYLNDVLRDLPVFAPLGLVNDSERVLLMIDEAHRTQSGDLGDNLFVAFPNAPRLAFTGTPLIKVKDQKTTAQRFGDYIDKYKLQDAVDDIDYIVVHELAHLIHSNHSAAFWNEVDKVMPDFQERKIWLRDNGAGMDL